MVEGCVCVVGLEHSRGIQYIHLDLVYSLSVGGGSANEA